MAKFFRASVVKSDLTFLVLRKEVFFVNITPRCGFIRGSVSFFYYTDPLLFSLLNVKNKYLKTLITLYYHILTQCATEWLLVER